MGLFKLGTRPSQNLFFREFDKVSQLSDDQKSISYLSQFDIQNEYEEGTPCYEPLTNLILGGGSKSRLKKTG